MLGNEKFGIRQLFERQSCTYTYLLWDKKTLDAVLIDPVVETFERDVRILKQMNLNLKFVLETHLHADHITSVSKFLDDDSYDVTAIYSLATKLEGDNVRLLSDNEYLNVSENLVIKLLETPGHTDCSACFVVDGHIFTGDTLFIKGCGRTDFQQGSPETLYKMVHEKIFSLNDDTVILPGHDYKGELYSTVGEEKKFNPRLKLENSMEDFVKIMDGLNLAYPAKIDVALPANKNLGRVE